MAVMLKRPHAGGGGEGEGGVPGAAFTLTRQASLASNCSGGPPVLAGYLKKRSRRGFWQRRHFRVYGHYLNYYKSDGVDAQDMLASVNLRDCGDVFTDDRFGNFRLELAEGRVFLRLRADGPKACHDWVKALRDGKEAATAAPVKKRFPEAEEEEEEETQSSSAPPSSSSSSPPAGDDGDERPRAASVPRRSVCPFRDASEDALRMAEEITQMNDRLNTFFTECGGEPPLILGAAETAIDAFERQVDRFSRGKREEEVIEELRTRSDVPHSPAMAFTQYRHFFHCRLTMELAVFMEMTRLPAEHLLRLLRWLQRYTSALQRVVGEEEARERTNDVGDVDVLIQRFVGNTAEGVSSCCDNLLGRALAMLQSPNVEETDFFQNHEGRFQTRTSVELFRLLNEAVSVAQDSGDARLVVPLCEECCRAATRYTESLTRAVFLYNDASPDVLVATINDNAACCDHAEALAESVDGLENTSEVFERMQEAFVRCSSACAQVIVDQVFKDVEKLYDEQLFQRAWLAPSGNVVKTIMATFIDYLDEYRETIHPFYFRRLMLKVMDTAIVRYVRALIAAYRAKSNRLAKWSIAEEGIQQMDQDEQIMRECWQRYLDGRYFVERVQVLSDVRLLLIVPIDNVPTIMETILTLHESCTVHVYDAVRFALRLRADVPPRSQLEHTLQQICERIAGETDPDFEQSDFGRRRRLSRVKLNISDRLAKMRKRASSVRSDFSSRSRGSGVGSGRTTPSEDGGEEGEESGEEEEEEENVLSKETKDVYRVLFPLAGRRFCTGEAWVLHHAHPTESELRAAGLEEAWQKMEAAAAQRRSLAMDVQRQSEAASPLSGHKVPSPLARTISLSRDAAVEDDHLLLAAAGSGHVWEDDAVQAAAYTELRKRASSQIAAPFSANVSPASAGSREHVGSDDSDESGFGGDDDEPTQEFIRQQTPGRHQIARAVAAAAASPDSPSGDTRVSGGDRPSLQVSVDSEMSFEGVSCRTRAPSTIAMRVARQSTTATEQQR